MAVSQQWGKSCLVSTALLAGVLVLLSRQGFCQSEITYLPRDEDVSTASRDYAAGAMRLQETPCNALDNLVDSVAQCNYCVTQLQPSCPDCCLYIDAAATPPVRTVRCTEADPATDCLTNFNETQQAFTSTTCTDVTCSDYTTVMLDCSKPTDIPECQRKGCGTFKPKDSSVDCEVGATNITCADKTNPFVLDGCPIRASCTNLVAPPAQLTLNYEGEVSCPPALAALPSAPTVCHEYNLTDTDWETWEQDCTEYADDWEQCQKDTICCKTSSACSLRTPPGFTPNCNLVRCVERVNFPACDSFTVNSCIAMNQQVQDTINADTPTSTNCFVQIDSNFSYRFVAKSDDNMVILWQLATTPNSDKTEEQIASLTANQQVQFYTRVKVFELNSSGADATLVHTSITHQKTLKNSFSIFCATQITGSILQQGKAYRVRLYYYLPHVQDPTGLTNTVEVHSMRLIMARTRE